MTKPEEQLSRNVTIASNIFVTGSPHGELTSMKKTISVAEITADLKNGIPDAELMSKYGLSENGLKRLLDILLQAACNGSRHVEVESEG